MPWMTTQYVIANCGETVLIGNAEAEPTESPEIGCKAVGEDGVTYILAEVAPLTALPAR